MSAVRQIAFLGVADRPRRGGQGLLVAKFRCRKSFVAEVDPGVLANQLMLAAGGYPADNAANDAAGAGPAGRKASLSSGFRLA